MWSIGPYLDHDTEKYWCRSCDKKGTPSDIPYDIVDSTRVYHYIVRRLPPLPPTPPVVDDLNSAGLEASRLAGWEGLAGHNEEHWNPRVLEAWRLPGWQAGRVWLILEVVLEDCCRETHTARRLEGVVDVL